MTKKDLQQRLKDLRTIYRGLAHQHAQALREDDAKDANYIRVELVATGKAVQRIEKTLAGINRMK